MTVELKKFFYSCILNLKTITSTVASNEHLQNKRRRNCNGDLKIGKTENIHRKVNSNFTFSKTKLKLTINDA